MYANYTPTQILTALTTKTSSQITFGSLIKSDFRDHV